MKIKGKDKIKSLRMKDKMKTIRMRYGSYRAATIAIVLAILVVINLMAGLLPAKYTSYDISSTGYYSIGEMTETVVGNIDRKVDIFVLAKEEEMDDILHEMLQRYLELTDKLSVSYVDTALNPGFAAEYDAQNATAGSLVVVSELRSTVVDYSEIYEVEYDYSSYYTTGQLGYSQSYNGESKVTSAIDYVTSETLPVLYSLTGHEEMSLPSAVSTQIQQLNIEMEELNLLTAGEIPEDASALLIYGPGRDISEEEADLIIAYLEAGGAALIMPQLLTTETPNLDRVLEAYGLSMSHSLILEGNEAYYYQSPAQLVPDVQSHEITDPILDGDLNLLLYEPQGILISDDVRSTLDITSLVTTTDEAYGKDISSGQISSAEREDGDLAGPFSLAAAVTETVGEEETRLVAISAQYLVHEEITGYYTVGNVDLFLNSLSWMCRHESTISIAAKALETPTITLTDAQINFWRSLSMYVVPGALLVCGTVIFFMRRKK